MKPLETRTQEKSPENIANDIVDQISGWRPILGTAQELLVLRDICALTCKCNSRTIEALHVECRGCVNLSTCIMLCPAITSDCTCIPQPVGHPWATMTTASLVFFAYVKMVKDVARCSNSTCYPQLQSVSAGTGSQSGLLCVIDIAQMPS